MELRRVTGHLGLAVLATVLFYDIRALQLLFLDQSINPFRQRTSLDNAFHIFPLNLFPRSTG